MPFQIVTTVHKDVAERLMQVNPALAKEARKVLDINKSERHIRGGLATREKYLHQNGNAPYLQVSAVRTRDR